MIDFEIFPNQDFINHMTVNTPDWMCPSSTPSAVIHRGFLTPDECEQIISSFKKITPHDFPGCNATTYEQENEGAGVPECLMRIKRFGELANERYFGFDTTFVSAYMQEYGPGGRYTLHRDAATGQSRKLTVVAILSKNHDYTGGGLRLLPYPEYFDVPRDQGTVVCYPSWVLHEVFPLVSGKRYSINMGWWGPPFR